MSLKRLYDLDKAFPDQLDRLLHDKAYVDGLRELPDPELVQLVDHLNDVLIRLDRSGNSSRKCLHILRKICSSRNILPTACELSRDVSPTHQLPDAVGGFCDVYEGTLSVKVCIKRLRVSASDREKVKELFYKEAVVWGRLNHPNIVPFRGVTLDPLQLISEWMPGGELREHAKKNRDTDLVSLSLGIAEGLAYLHSCGVVHGDLKGSNIMVDESGNARIMDFGLAVIVRDPNSLASPTDDHGHTFRWTAPEILKSNKASMESDVFSFGMVMIEVFTGEVPFKGVKSSEVVMRITRGERPGRPSHPRFTNPLWGLTRRCWTEAMQDRPRMEEAIEVLKAQRSAVYVTKALPKPPGESPAVMAGPPAMVSRQPSACSTHPKTSVDGDGVTIPYEVDTPQPEPKPPQPPPKDGVGGHLVHGSTRGVAGGTTDRSSSGRLPKSGDTNPSGNDSDGGKSRDPWRLDTGTEITPNVSFSGFRRLYRKLTSRIAVARVPDDTQSNQSGDEIAKVQLTEVRNNRQQIDELTVDPDNSHQLANQTHLQRTGPSVLKQTVPDAPENRSDFELWFRFFRG